MLVNNQRHYAKHSVFSYCFLFHLAQINPIQHATLILSGPCPKEWVHGFSQLLYPILAMVWPAGYHGLMEGGSTTFLICYYFSLLSYSRARIPYSYFQTSAQIVPKFITQIIKLSFSTKNHVATNTRATTTENCSACKIIIRFEVIY